MATSAYPAIVDALISTLEGAVSCRVVDGYDNSSDPGDVVMVGVADLLDTNAISSGSFTQAVGPAGSSRPRDETGSINGVVWAWNGEGDPAAARSAAFGYFADLEDALRADPELGLTGYRRLTIELAAGSVLEDKEDGANCALPFTVNYIARI